MAKRSPIENRYSTRAEGSALTGSAAGQCIVHNQPLVTSLAAAAAAAQVTPDFTTSPHPAHLGARVTSVGKHSTHL